MYLHPVVEKKRSIPVDLIGHEGDAPCSLSNAANSSHLRLTSACQAESAILDRANGLSNQKFVYGFTGAAGRFT
ncbi:hypothetical protein [Burkholderia sp. JP2-270]|uniref:hypothetical protein n=1 Tax=Burkholderia sp. JP2-270 TaxID=2217913 RepID=UPI0013A6B6FA|nr:hypothetical protein [Burkholderia sp. JP2-270]